MLIYEQATGGKAKSDTGAIRHASPRKPKKAISPQNKGFFHVLAVKPETFLEVKKLMTGWLTSSARALSRVCRINAHRNT
jgi:hypothetical protein